VAGLGSYHPSWDGPHCFIVEPPPVFSIQGYSWYQDPTPNSYPGLDSTEEPMRFVKIEMFDLDSNGSQSLGSMYTDEDGWFEFNDISNVDSNGTGGQDVFFEVTAQNTRVVVLKDVYSNKHIWATPVAYDLADGFYDTLMIASVDESKPFFVADAILDGHSAWESQWPPNQYFVPYGQVFLMADSMSSGYDSYNDLIFINDSVDNNNGWPDTWNRSTMLHEFGHRISSTYSFCDDTTNSPSSHLPWVAYNLQFAAMEGFAHWWSAFVDSTPIRTYYWDDFTDSLWLNFENGEYGHTTADGSFNAMGPKCEGAVAGILWDIFDNPDDGYSDRADWGTLNLGPHYDGIDDYIQEGSDDILDALLNRYYGPNRPDNIHEFHQTWFQSPDLGYCQEMYNLFYEHGDSLQPPPKSCSCCLNRGNVDNIIDRIPIDISDLVYLVDFMFTGGPPPPCWEQGSVDGDAASDIDVNDLIYLIDWMFTGGDAPPSCPQ